MTLEQRINALPSIKDEAGSDCVSREVVKELIRPVIVAGDTLNILNRYVEPGSPTSKAWREATQ